MFSEVSQNLSNKQHFFAQQNVLQNLRHKRDGFQCKIIELTPWVILDPLPTKNIWSILVLLVEPPLGDYIIR